MKFRRLVDVTQKPMMGVTMLLLSSRFSEKVYVVLLTPLICKHTTQ